MVSFLRMRQQCDAGGDNYYRYGGAPQPDGEHKAPCPVCGKVVQLRKYIGDKHYIRIPTHFKRKEQKA